MPNIFSLFDEGDPSDPTYRSAMMPVGSYKNPDGSESLGFAWPGMITEPINALSRLADNSRFPDGRLGIPNPSNPENQQDVLTGLLSMYGGNALNPAAAIPKNALGVFAGRMAKTADLPALSKAETLAASGVPREQIWNDTGWFQGPDQKWRFEIDDSQSKLGPMAEKELMSGGDHGATQRTARGFLQHPEMYDAYPDLMGVDVDARYNANLRDSFKQGHYQHSVDANGGRPKLSMTTNSMDGDWSPRSVGLHEFQHGIQTLEGFAPGGAKVKPDKALRSQLIDEQMRTMGPIAKAQGVPLDAMRKVVAKKVDGDWGQTEVYKRLAGETEARNVQTRQDMSADQRRATPPWLTQDVPFGDQILRSDTGRPSLLGGLLADDPQQRRNSLLDY